jgi:hypothetical protein
MDIKTIDGTIDYISIIMQRNLSGEEILILGIAFQNGILKGLQEAENRKGKNNENI